jgi:hypothetical protein
MGLLDRMFNLGDARAASADVDGIIARLVKVTDKRLAYIPGYEAKLRAPVREARDRMREVVARIPGPTEVSAKAWGADPTVRVLFARAADVSPAFSDDANVRSFFEMHPASDCFAMLALARREKRMPTSEMQGEMQVEVTRTTVNFTEPVVLAPATAEESTRDELVVRALENLAMRALERVGTMRAERRELEKERALLSAQLRLAQSRGAGFGAVGAVGSTKAELERDLEQAVAELQRAAKVNLTPLLLDEMLAVFAAPGEYLAVEPETVAVDSMNFKVQPGPGAATPQVAVLKLARREPYAVLIARFPRAELKIVDRLAEAEKFL